MDEPPHPPPPIEDIRDLGFGSRMARQSRHRFLNRDGTFNVTRRGLPLLRHVNLYHTLLNISWPRFMALVAILYFLANLVFAGIYFLCGPQALRGSAAVTPEDRFLDDFFFSVQTLNTVGYGGLAPQSLAANLVVAVEGLVALLFFATATGLVFARFSRPVARAREKCRKEPAPRKEIPPYPAISALNIEQKI